MKFSLVNQAAAVGVKELHRIFDRDDVAGTLTVYLMNQSRKRGRFATTGWPGNQHQSVPQFGQLAKLRRQSELSQRAKIAVQAADGNGDLSALAIQVDAKSRALLA